MRRTTSITAAAAAALGLLAAPLAQAEPCARTTEKSAFDITGLKSQLMVTAITCRAEEKYNAFVLRYRTDLVSQDKALNGYFNRTAGRRAQQQHDDYITALANSQSQDGLKLGTLFCDKNMGLFDEVMALKSGKELPGYASGKGFVQPIALIECPPPPPAKVRTAKK